MYILVLKNQIIYIIHEICRAKFRVPTHPGKQQIYFTCFLEFCRFSKCHGNDLEKVLPVKKMHLEQKNLQINIISNIGEKVYQYIVLISNVSFSHISWSISFKSCILCHGKWSVRPGNVLENNISFSAVTMHLIQLTQKSHIQHIEIIWNLECENDLTMKRYSKDFEMFKSETGLPDATVRNYGLTVTVI